MAKIATHDAIVTSVTPGRITAQMHVSSACASCEAHAKCGFADSKEKLVEVETPHWQQYHEGDSIVVEIKSGLGLLAVLIAYILPAVVLLAVFAVLTLAHLPEVWVALLTLVAVALYGVVLYLFRNRLQRKFAVGIRDKR